MFVLCLGLLPILVTATTHTDKIELEQRRPEEVKQLHEPYFPNAAVRSTGGPDDFGYSWIDSDEPGGPVFNWIEISGSGTPTIMGDDDEFWPVPFTFTFYGVTYDTICIGSNGGIYFEDDYLTLGNTALPWYSVSYDLIQLILPHWDDLNPNAAGADDVYYQIIGDQLVIEWHQVPRYGYTNYMTFEVILDASTGDIIFQYLDLAGETGISATVGIQGDTTVSPAWYLQYSYNTASLHNNLAIKFYTQPSSYVWDFEDGWQGWTHTSAQTFPAAWDVMTTSYVPGGGYWTYQAPPDAGDSAFIIDDDYAGPSASTIDTAMSPVVANPGFAMLKWGYYVVVYDTMEVLVREWTGSWGSWNVVAAYRGGGPAWDSADVSAYTGDSIQVAFHYNDEGYWAYGATFDNVSLSLPPTHDAGTVAILAPGSDILPSATVDPAATYHNFGGQSETFDVYFLIDSAGVNIYNETANITLDAGVDTTIVWPSWTTGPAPGIVYDVTAYTDLTGDVDPANDTLAQQTTTAAWTTWQPFSPPPTSMDRLTHATVYDPDGDLIYMIGGNPSGSSGQNYDLNYSYDPNTDTWNTSLATMPTARGWIQGAYWDGKIYVIGGLNNSSAAITANEIYDITANAWATGAPLPVPNLAHGTVAWNGNIYVVGGWDGVSTSGRTSVYRYDIAGNTWSTATSLPMAFDMGGVTIWDNVIYLCGGVLRGTPSQAWTHVYSGTIDTGNPDNITWAQLDPLPTPNSINGATAMGGKIYMLGGFLNLSTATNDFWEYDPAMNTWTQLDDYVVTIVRNHMVIARRGHNEIYAVAGDADGNWAVPNQEYNKIAQWMPGVSEQPGSESVAKTSLSLSPNIGNQMVKISFTLATPGHASVSLYNTLGQKVMTVLDSRNEVTSYTIDLSVKKLPSGIYFVRLDSGNVSMTDKLVITK